MAYIAIPTVDGAAVVKKELSDDARAKIQSGVYVYPITADMRAEWKQLPLSREYIISNGVFRKKTIADDIDKAKSDIQNAIDFKTRELIGSGFIINAGGVDYVCDTSSTTQQNVVSQWAEIASGESFVSFDVRLLDPVQIEGLWCYYISLSDVNKFKTYAKAMRSHIDPILREGRDLKGLLLDATDAAGVQAVADANNER